MNLFYSLRKLIKKINHFDKMSKRMEKEFEYSSNPFAFRYNRTYVWIEQIKKLDKCDRKNKHKNS